jgi:hypothetical protein
VRRGPEHDAVSLKRLTRQLRREVVKNPQKAAVLGLLAVVALWFWAPLVWGWIAGDDPAAGTTAAQPAANAPPAQPAGTPAQSNTTAKEPKTPRHPWRQLVKWMDNDPRTSAADPMFERPDPFLSAETRPAGDEPGQVQPELTPGSLGMVLSSTIIGPRRRVARINGKSYQQGETVKLAKDQQQIEFTLAEVYPRRIVLKRQGEQFELRIPAPAHSGRIELFGNKN